MSELPPNPPPTTTATTIPKSTNDHAPEGTPAERETILSGLSPAGGLGQTITLAVPRLVHDFRLAANLERKIGLGQSCWGERNWIGICGGVWSATWGKGRIVVCLSFISFLFPLTFFVCLFCFGVLLDLYRQVMNRAEQLMTIYAPCHPT